ncbi:MAG: OmpA family protein [Tetrasphaera sp.]
MSNGEESGAGGAGRWQAADAAGRRAGSGEPVTRWVEETRRYRRPLGGWWWLALLLVPAVLALLGGALGGDEPSAATPKSWATTMGSGTASSASAPSGETSAASSSGGQSSAASGDAAACSTLEDRIGEALAATKITFSRGGSVVSEASMPVLESVAGMVKACPDARLTITGYTDPSGDEAENQQISEARATAVLDQLAKDGVPQGSMSAVGKGEKDQIAGGTEANRRVEITVG